MEDLIEAVVLGQKIAWIAIFMYSLALLYSVPRVVRVVRAEKQGRHAFPGPMIHRNQMELQARLMRGKEPLYLFPSLVSTCWGLVGCVIVMILALLFLDNIVGWPRWLGTTVLVVFSFFAGMGFVQVLKSIRFSRLADKALIKAEAEYLEAKFH